MKLKITVDSKTYEVDVEVAEEPVRHPQAFMVMPSQARVPAAPTAPAAPTDSGPVDESRVCRSPITGTVVRLVAQPGQAIQPGDILLVLEPLARTQLRLMGKLPEPTCLHVLLPFADGPWHAGFCGTAWIGCINRVGGHGGDIVHEQWADLLHRQESAWSSANGSAQQLISVPGIHDAPIGAIPRNATPWLE